MIAPSVIPGAKADLHMHTHTHTHTSAFMHAWLVSTIIQTMECVSYVIEWFRWSFVYHGHT